MPEIGASNNSMNHRVLAWLQHGANAALVVGLVGLIVFVMFRLERATQTEIAFAEFKRISQTRLERGSALLQQHERRLDDLESFIFGSLEPKVTEQQQQHRPVEQWQRNRDDELRKSIQDLQRRLLRLESQE